MFRRIVAAAAVSCALACLALVLAWPALAADMAALGSKPVILPYGDWVVAFAQMLTAMLVPALVTLATGALYSVAPWAKLLISASLVDRMIRNATDYALNAVAGAAKGETLAVPLGSAVIAKAVQRAIDQAPGWLLSAAGGPSGVAEKVFRLLHLEGAASAANTLAPALAAVPSQPHG